MEWNCLKAINDLELDHVQRTRSILDGPGPDFLSANGLCIRLFSIRFGPVCVSIFPYKLGPFLCNKWKETMI